MSFCFTPTSFCANVLDFFVCFVVDLFASYPYVSICFIVLLFSFHLFAVLGVSEQELYVIGGQAIGVGVCPCGISSCKPWHRLKHRKATALLQSDETAWCDLESRSAKRSS